MPTSLNSQINLLLLLLIQAPSLPSLDDPSASLHLLASFLILLVFHFFSLLLFQNESDLLPYLTYLLPLPLLHGSLSASSLFSHMEPVIYLKDPCILFLQCMPSISHQLYRILEHHCSCLRSFGSSCRIHLNPCTLNHIAYTDLDSDADLGSMIHPIHRCRAAQTEPSTSLHAITKPTSPTLTSLHATTTSNHLLQLNLYCTMLLPYQNYISLINSLSLYILLPLSLS